MHDPSVGGDRVQVGLQIICTDKVENYIDSGIPIAPMTFASWLAAVPSLLPPASAVILSNSAGDVSIQNAIAWPS